MDRAEVVVVVVEALEYVLTRLMQLCSTPGLCGKIFALVLMSEEKNLLTILQPQQYGGPPQPQYYQEGPPYVFVNAPVRPKKLTRRLPTECNTNKSGTHPRHPSSVRRAP